MISGMVGVGVTESLESADSGLGVGMESEEVVRGEEGVGISLVEEEGGWELEADELGVEGSLGATSTTWTSAGTGSGSGVGSGEGCLGGRATRGDGADSSTTFSSTTSFFSSSVEPCWGNPYPLAARGLRTSRMGERMIGDASEGGSRLAEVRDVIGFSRGSGSTRGELGRDNGTGEGAETSTGEGAETMRFGLKGVEAPACTGRGEMMPARSERRPDDFFNKASGCCSAFASSGTGATATSFSFGDSTTAAEVGVVGDVTTSSSASAFNDLDEKEPRSPAGLEGGGEVTLLA